MVGTVHIVMRLLLLSFIRTGVNGEGERILSERGYDITYPCEENLVCFHIWQINMSQTSEYIAIISNGQIRAAESEENKCTLQIRDLTVRDVGLHRCQRPKVFSLPNTYSTAPMLNLMPAKTVSLQCVSLTSVERRHCKTNLQQQISLTWVDQAGAEVQEDSQHRIIQQSPCDKTLIVTFQSPEDKKFRCQATVGEEVQTSVEVLLRAPDLKGKGRGILIEPEPEPQGGKQDTVGAAVGVVGCLVLTVVVAVFVVNRRRTNSQQPDEPCSVQSSPNNVMNTDVIYADIILPGGSDRVWVHEYESTEYACVRYK